ncbi:MAG: hypothetical protein FWC01_07670 [Treponema sp.]|nr:hypothetical protein [Treponema sp.]MCL2237760.1 hypothetical protein [Treponema sp.]
MKKTLIFTLFLALALVSANGLDIDIPNRSIFIEGSSTLRDHLAFFNENFRMEASAMGYTIVNNKADAGFTFKFDAQNYTDDYDSTIKFIIMISLVFNESNTEMVSFGHPYRSLDEMYEFNQFVFYRAAVLIPPVGDDIINTLVTAASTGTTDNRWQNQILYLRLSLDYPIAIYQLLLDGLKGDAIYGGSTVPSSPPSPEDGWTDADRLHTIIWPSFGVTVGLEFHPFSFMALEANLHWNTTNGMTNDFYFAAAGELKFNIKLRNALIQPYLTFVYPLQFLMEGIGDTEGWLYPDDIPASERPVKGTDTFKQFPEFLVGGGVQIGINGGGKNVIFVNFSFTFALPMPEYQVIRHNNLNILYQLPTVIHYERYTFGIGLGYRFGFINRR